MDDKTVPPCVRRVLIICVAQLILVGGVGLWTISTAFVNSSQQADLLANGRSADARVLSRNSRPLFLDDELTVSFEVGGQVVVTSVRATAAVTAEQGQTLVVRYNPAHVAEVAV